MKWMEEIQVQAAGGREENLRRLLGRLPAKLPGEDSGIGLQAAAVYAHALFPGVFAVRLFWQTAPPVLRGSSTGLALVGRLREYGLINHSVWIEQAWQTADKMAGSGWTPILKEKESEK